MKFDREQLGTVTVWYNPAPVFVVNIQSYAHHSRLLTVVDNSADNNAYLFDKINHPNKRYLWSGQNLGIAAAFNHGLNLLISESYKFALTLDQDSSFESNELEKLLKAAEGLDFTNVGILSPIHVQQITTGTYHTKMYTPAISVMASGNILNLEIAKKAGFFNEQLFIDHVDNEYCLRLNKHGFAVLITNSFLTHELGKYREFYFIGIRLGGFISHPPAREYFFVRNSLYVLRRYFFLNGKYTLSEIISLVKRFVKLFFEEQSKERLRLYLKGIRDYRKIK